MYSEIFSVNVHFRCDMFETLLMRPCYNQLVNGVQLALYVKYIIGSNGSPCLTPFLDA